jgi:hypothetical protein
MNGSLTGLAILFMMVFSGTQTVAEPIVAVVPEGSQSQQKIESHLKTIWNGMKAAIMAKDIEGALVFLSPAQRPRYRSLFSSLGGQVTNMANELGDIQVMTFSENQAKCRLYRREPYSGRQMAMTNYVQFIRDEAGSWLIQEF